MGYDIGYQIFLFFVCCLCGITIAFIFDTLRVSRKVVNTGIVLTFIEDLLFWILSAIILFALSLRFNNGEIRWYMIAGVVIGAFMYFKTVSAFIVRFLVFIANVTGKIVRFILGLLFIPFKALMRCVNKPLFLVLSFSRKSIAKLCRKIKFKLKIFIKFPFFNRK